MHILVMSIFVIIYAVPTVSSQLLINIPFCFNVNVALTTLNVLYIFLVPVFS